MRSVIVAVLLASMLFASGCKATPEHLDRWENREGSEEMFKKHLLNPDADDAVRVRALELLAKQWRYSSTMFRDGLLSEMPDTDARERIVATALPSISQGLASEDETTRVYARDALFTIRRQITSEANIEKVDVQLKSWLSKEWTADPCREIGGVRAAQIFNELGQEKTQDILAGLFDEGEWEKTYCGLQNTKNVSWRAESEPVASALLGFWDRGLVPEGFQSRVAFLDELSTFAALEPVRNWAFSKIRDETLATNDRGIMVALLSRTWVDSDLPKYKEMLNNADLYRWEAVRALITMQNEKGLELALTNLPAESDYAFWDGARRTNGFNQAAQFVCNLPRMKEMPEKMRPVLEKQAEEGHLYARAISIECLGTLGDENSIAKLQAIKAGISRADDLVIPFWSADSEVSLTQAIDNAILKIQEAAAAAEAAKAVIAAAAEAPAEGEDAPAEKADTEEAAE